MKPIKASTRKRAEGMLREVEGALQEAVRAAARDRELEREGKHERRAGRVKGGRIEKAAGK